MFIIGHHNKGLRQSEQAAMALFSYKLCERSPAWRCYMTLYMACTTLGMPIFGLGTYCKTSSNTNMREMTTSLQKLCKCSCIVLMCHALLLQAHRPPPPPSSSLPTHDPQNQGVTPQQPHAEAGRCRCVLPVHHALPSKHTASVLAPPHPQPPEREGTTPEQPRAKALQVQLCLAGAWRHASADHRASPGPAEAGDHKPAWHSYKSKPLHRVAVGSHLFCGGAGKGEGGIREGARCACCCWLTPCCRWGSAHLT